MNTGTSTCREGTCKSPDSKLSIWLVSSSSKTACAGMAH